MNDQGSDVLVGDDDNNFAGPVHRPECRALDFWRRQLTGIDLHPWLIYGGETREDRDRATVLPWTGSSVTTAQSGTAKRKKPGHRRGRAV